MQLAYQGVSSHLAQHSVHLPGITLVGKSTPETTCSNPAHDYHCYMLRLFPSANSSASCCAPNCLLYWRRGAGPCHKSNRVEETGTILPTPIGLRELVYHAFAMNTLQQTTTYLFCWRGVLEMGSVDYLPGQLYYFACAWIRISLSCGLCPAGFFDVHILPFASHQCGRCMPVIWSSNNERIRSDLFYQFANVFFFDNGLAAAFSMP
jgi:hypothetical protein